MQTDPAPHLTGLALVAHHAGQMADEFDLKGTAAVCTGGKVEMPGATAREASRVIRAYIAIANGLEISRDAMQARAEAAEVAAVAASALLTRIDQLSLLGLFFFWLGRTKK